MNCKIDVDCQNLAAVSALSATNDLHLSQFSAVSFAQPPSRLAGECKKNDYTVSLAVGFFQAVVPTLSRSVSCRRRRRSVSVESSISDDSSTIYDDLRAVPAGQSGTIAFHGRPTAINNDDYM